MKKLNYVCLSFCHYPVFCWGMCAADKKEYPKGYTRPVEYNEEEDRKK